MKNYQTAKTFAKTCERLVEDNERSKNKLPPEELLLYRLAADIGSDESMPRKIRKKSLFALATLSVAIRHLPGTCSDKQSESVDEPSYLDYLTDIKRFVDSVNEGNGPIYAELKATASGILDDLLNLLVAYSY